MCRTILISRSRAFRGWKLCGTLRAEENKSGEINHAGIRGGSITVKGGTVIAKGEYGAAGIGGDAGRSTNDNFSISIEGGTVEADGGWEVPASEAQTRQAEMSISVFPAEP